MDIKILLSFDYEIFGNGTGLVQCCMIKPMTRLIGVCDLYDVKITVFFEMGHYWALQSAIDEGINVEEFKKQIYLIEEQLKLLIQKGHDVQFHFHSQWLQRKWDGNRWILNEKLIPLPIIFNHTLNNQFTNFDQIFKKAKLDLEQLLKPVDNNYQCIAFRAGYLCVQPSDEILNAAKRQGFLCDSSVLPFAECKSNLVNYDFRRCSNSSWWRIDPVDVVTPSMKGELIEVPIGSVILTFLQRLQLKMLSSFATQEMFNHTCDGFPIPLNFNRSSRLKKLRTFFSNKQFTLDFCEHSATRLNFLASKHLLNSQDQLLHLFGHSKSWKYPEEFNLFLQKILNKYGEKNNIQFLTIRSLIDSLVEENKNNEVH